jgi:hypothetical protein
MGGNLTIGGFSISRLWATAPQRASAELRQVLDLIAEGHLDIAITEVGSLAVIFGLCLAWRPRWCQPMMATRFRAAGPGI